MHRPPSTARAAQTAGAPPAASTPCVCRAAAEPAPFELCARSSLQTFTACPARPRSRALTSVTWMVSYNWPTTRVAATSSFLPHSAGAPSSRKQPSRALQTAGLGSPRPPQHPCQHRAKKRAGQKITPIDHPSTPTSQPALPARPDRPACPTRVTCARPVPRTQVQPPAPLEADSRAGRVRGSRRRARRAPLGQQGRQRGASRGVSVGFPRPP